MIARVSNLPPLPDGPSSATLHASRPPSGAASHEVGATGARLLPDSDLELAQPVRLVREVLTLDDGHRVGVAIAGRGVPFVVVHGFGVESLLYAQPLARLAALGFQVIAIDIAGHGETQRLGGLPNLDAYVDLLRRAIDTLGIRRAVLAGHSMGGRLVAEVAVTAPETAIGVVLIDAILGDAWERLRTVLRWSPPALLAYGTAFLIDTAGTVPLIGDVRQALKLGSRAGRSVNLHLARPWRALGPGRAILRADRGDEVLDRLRDSGVAVSVIHGDRDLMVPFAAGRDAARRAGAELVRVSGGSHSWLLRCPETLPAIIGELLDGRLGEARDAALVSEGCDPATATAEEMEAACTQEGGIAGALGAEREVVMLASLRRRPRLRWTVQPAPGPA